MQPIRQLFSQAAWVALVAVALGTASVTGASAQAAGRAAFASSLPLASGSLAPADTTLGKIIIVYVFPTGFSGKYRRAEFGTDGQQIAGLSEKELNKKFDNFLGTSSMLNFLVRNGYRLLTATEDRGGYTYFLEKER
ncbi:MAG: hypothetical protein ACRYFX_15510 [Janthinobacterium lividum]